MDIPAVRLGFAYCSLKQVLGEDFAPISFADQSLAFINRSSGKIHFCSATRDGLWIAQAKSDGTLGDGRDPESSELSARCTPQYATLCASFERDFDSATMAESRLLARGQSQPDPVDERPIHAETLDEATHPEPINPEPIRSRFARAPRPARDRSGTDTV